MKTLSRTRISRNVFLGSALSLVLLILASGCSATEQLSVTEIEAPVSGDNAVENFGIEWRTPGESFVLTLSSDLFHCDGIVDSAEIVANDTVIVNLSNRNDQSEFCVASLTFQQFLVTLPENVRERLTIRVSTPDTEVVLSLDP
ncbi:MAG: hypothetical protein ACTH31_00740 [Pseudoclavibacter sp.]